MKKRALSLFLVWVLLVSLVPHIAAAAETELVLRSGSTLKISKNSNAVF